MFCWAKVKRPILTLAPMAGYTDCAFRQIVKELCPSVVCFTEFTSVEGLLHGNEATRRQIKFKEKERPVIAQIFGKRPENFAKAAKILEQLGIDAIDINMGCPARKIVSSDHGSALLKNPNLAQEIVAATASATPLPISVKMRIGIAKYEPEYFFDFAKRIESAGAKLITVHGRIAKQMYGGSADWQPIYELKKILKIPVIGNGDIKNGADAALKLGLLDGIMIGRGALGNPWIFLEIAAALKNKTFTPLTFAQKLPIIKRHIELSCKLKDEKWGILEMRKHLSFFVRGIPHASELRQKLVRAISQKEIFAILEVLQ